MTRKQERNIIASIGTVVFMGLVLVLLLFLSLTVHQPEQPDYIEVVMEEPEEPEVPKPQPKTPVRPGADPGAASPAQSEPTPQPTQQSAEQIVSEEELLAIRQQAIADSIAEANRQAKKKAENVIGGLNFGVVEENGVAETKTDQGGRGSAHKGEGSDGENKWSLKGRGLVGSLPRPANTFNQAGKVVVQISVDAAGNVTEAVVVGGNISDKATIQLAVDAAKKAKFTSDKNIKQVGTITYTFKFN